MKNTLSTCAAIALLGLALTSCQAPPPNNLGLKNDRLAPCPSSPNCVNSMHPSDSTHYQPAWTIAAPMDRVRQKLLDILQETNKVQIQSSEAEYIHAVFTIPILGFQDDVEFYLPPDQEKIHYRSASRLGRSDLGVNRRRMEKLRAKLVREGALQK